jgi:iron complex outermembrane receptor protein
MPQRNTGVEAVAIWKTKDFSFVGNYAFVHSRQDADNGRAAVPLTPQHSVGLDAAWELGDVWRLGVEWYYTGRQRLDANPYRDESAPYHVFGILASRRVGRAMLFVNGENLTDVKQTDPGSLAPAVARRRWPVDGRCVGTAWRRVINGGLRLKF